LDLLGIYLLNLLVTVAMFIVLIFRAWVEFKNYKILWKEFEWQKTRETAIKVLKDEEESFSKMEGGKDLFDILCHMFQVEE
jgi:hypothetical protein